MNSLATAHVLLVLSATSGPNLETCVRPNAGEFSNQMNDTTKHHIPRSRDVFWCSDKAGDATSVKRGDFVGYSNLVRTLRCRWGKTLFYASSVFSRGRLTQNLKWHFVFSVEQKFPQSPDLNCQSDIFSTWASGLGTIQELRLSEWVIFTASSSNRFYSRVFNTVEPFLFYDFCVGVGFVFTFWILFWIHVSLFTLFLIVLWLFIVLTGH